MHNFQIIKSILSEPWLLSSEEASKLGHLFLALFKPNNYAFDPTEKREEARVAYQAQVKGQGATRSGRIGVVEMIGPLSKYDPGCDYGMESYGEFIQEFDRNQEIDAIVLKIDSPGGTVAGTEELSAIIMGCSKPVIGFISDMACSGAYWLGISCTELYANNSTATVGSIGVMCSVADLSEHFAKLGIKIHEILAPQSQDKNQASRDIPQGKYELTTERLGVYAQKFISHVQERRPKIQDDQLTGKVYFAKDVVGSMVDGIASFDQAMVRALDLAEDITAQHQTDNNMSKQPLYPALALAAGIAAFESVDGSITLTPDQAEAIERRLTDLSERDEAKDNQAQELASARQKITALEAENAVLKKDPGAHNATVAPETDALESEGSSVSSFYDAAAECREFIKTFHDNDD